MKTFAPCISVRGFVAATILGTAALSLSAVSAADPSVAGVTVKYSDLNVESPPGARVLYERIQVAAESACKYFWFKTDADEVRCQQNTIADAVARVNRPALTAVYDAKVKTAAPPALLSQTH